MFSPPRVFKQGGRLGLKSGSSMDQLTGWSFDLKVDRDRAIKTIKEEKPMLVIVSPPCTYFSMPQEPSKFNRRHNERWLERFNDNPIKVTDHLKICIKLYRVQMDKGRY